MYTFTYIVSKNGLGRKKWSFFSDKWSKISIKMVKNFYCFGTFFLYKMVKNFYKSGPIFLDRTS